MAVSFRLPSSRPVDLVGFGWSPLFEAVLSLRVLAQPKRTPLHLPWARRCRDLPDDLRSEIRVLAQVLTGFVPGVFEVGLAEDLATFEDELDAMARLPDDLVAWELSLALGGLGCSGDAALSMDVVHDPAYRADVVARASSPEQAALVRDVLDDPAAVVARYRDMLRRYWDLAFAAEWERILPRIEAEVTHGAHALVTRGASGLVEELLPEATWDEATTTILVDRDCDGGCDVAARGGVQLVPTVYGWPRVLIELAEPWPVLVVFPLRDLRRPEVPLAQDHEVADGMRALGDETRLQIARLVAEEPRSTKELAELLSLSDSAVSRHLRTLDAAGIVEGERDGYFVLYRLRPERIGQLGGALRHTLGLARSVVGQVPSLPVALSRTDQRAEVVHG